MDILIFFLILAVIGSFWDSFVRLPSITQIAIITGVVVLIALRIICKTVSQALGKNKPDE